MLTQLPAVANSLTLRERERGNEHSPCTVSTLQRFVHDGGTASHLRGTAAPFRACMVALGEIAPDDETAKSWAMKAGLKVVDRCRRLAKRALGRTANRLKAARSREARNALLRATVEEWGSPAVVADLRTPVLM